MQNITFSNSSKSLVWSTRGKWQSVSVPWGKEALPVGIYTVERRKLTAYTTNIGQGFKDKIGKGYFIPITPQFD